MAIDVTALKTTKLGVVFGIGMITHMNGEPYYDSDNQHFPDDVMLKCTTEFMMSDRINNSEHTEITEGTVVHSFPLTKENAEAYGIDTPINGWLIAVKVNDDTLKKFESGEYRGFSIEGTAHWLDE